MSRQIDALIAEKVMKSAIPHWTEQQYLDALPHYSTDIAAAWEVIKKLGEKYDRVFITQHWNEDYLVEIEHQSNRPEPATYWEAESETVEMAICLAALKAKNINIEETTTGGDRTPEKGL